MEVDGLVKINDENDKNKLLTNNEKKKGIELIDHRNEMEIKDDIENSRKKRRRSSAIIE